MTTLPPDRVPYAEVPKLWRDLFDEQIGRWEGKYQADPDDSGNWTSDGRNLGTMRGVTPGALADFLGIPDTRLTVEDMTAITHERAVEIGYWGYVDAPDFERLPRNRLTEFYVDWGWGSGPITAVRELQRLIGTTPDGVIGPQTIASFNQFVAWARYTYQGRPFDGLEAALHHAVDRRVEDLRGIAARKPRKRKFLGGWLRRAEAFRPLTDVTPPETADPLPKPVGDDVVDGDPQTIAEFLVELLRLIETQNEELSRVATALEGAAGHMRLRL